MHGLMVLMRVTFAGIPLIPGLLSGPIGREDFSHTISWLNTHNIDVPDTIAYLKKHGIHCDADAASLDFRGRRL